MERRSTQSIHHETRGNSLQELGKTLTPTDDGLGGDKERLSRKLKKYISKIFILMILKGNKK
jgi:hypothetical protein